MSNDFTPVEFQAAERRKKGTSTPRSNMTPSWDWRRHHILIPPRHFFSRTICQPQRRNLDSGNRVASFTCDDFLHHTVEVWGRGEKKRERLQLHAPNMTGMPLKIRHWWNEFRSQARLSFPDPFANYGRYTPTVNVSGSRRREKPGLYVSRPTNSTPVELKAAERRKKDLQQLHYFPTLQHSWEMISDAANSTTWCPAESRLWKIQSSTPTYVSNLITFAPVESIFFLLSAAFSTPHHQTY